MKPAFVVHNELTKYLTKDSCFNTEELEIISTSHLQNPEKICKILRKKIITEKDIIKLIHTLLE